MLQVQTLLVAAEAPLVPCHALPLLPDLHVGRQQPRLAARPGLQRGRIPVRPHLHATFAVHRREAGLGQLKALGGQWQGTNRRRLETTYCLPTLAISADRKSTRLNSSHLGISYA